MAILEAVALNMEIMGRKEKNIITGTVMEVAIICVLLKVPIAAPSSRDARMPKDRMHRKEIPSVRQNLPAMQMTACSQTRHRRRFPADIQKALRLTSAARAACSVLSPQK